MSKCLHCNIAAEPSELEIVSKFQKLRPYGFLSTTPLLKAGIAENGATDCCGEIPEQQSPEPIKRGTGVVNILLFLRH